MTRNAYILLLVVVAYSCWNEKPTRFDHTTPERTVEEEKEEEYKGEDRHIWQKPDLIISQLGNLENKKIADIGAGSGYFSFRFLQAGADVLAIDIDPRMIELMEKEVELFKADFQKRFNTRLALPDNPKIGQEEVDHIFVSNTYPYIENRIEYFSKLKTSFRKEGRLIIVDFKKKRTPIGPPASGRVALAQVEEELMTAGYEVLNSDDKSLSYQYIVIARPKL